MEVAITFTDEEAGMAHTFSGNTVLVFIDETGHELLKDKNYPVFGLGGCVCLAKDYHKQIVEPWKQVESVFDKALLPLHASALSKNETTDAQFDVINNFFAANAFGRFACILSDRTENTSLYDDFFVLAVADLHERMSTLMQWLAFDAVVMFIESSERTKQKITNTFSQYGLKVDDTEIPIHHFFMHKKHNHAGIIVADFIIQTAGSTVASKGRNRITSYTVRKDFRNVFCSVDERLSSFIEINAVTSP